MATATTSSLRWTDAGFTETGTPVEQNFPWASPRAGQPSVGGRCVLGYRVLRAQGQPSQSSMGSSSTLANIDTIALHGRSKSAISVPLPCANKSGEFRVIGPGGEV